MASRRTQTSSLDQQRERPDGVLSHTWDDLRFRRRIVTAFQFSRWRQQWRKRRGFTVCFLIMIALARETQALYRSGPGKGPDPSAKGRSALRGTRPEPGKRATDGAGIPCIYEGHLETDKNWYGYLANISVRTTGQLIFEFAYPADRCCQNVLFYLEDQLPLMSPRMNCWQREYLLRPEDDQILRLTPSFSWSGCHLTQHEGVDMFVCKGGRSFSVDSVNGRLTTWYIAVSNCAILQGLDLLYRFEIYGHVGECSQSSLTAHDVTTAVAKSGAVVKASLTPREATNTHQHKDSEACILQGSVNTTNPWYGFIRNLSLNSGGGFRFVFTYPMAMQVQNVILYTEDDIRQLNWEQPCYEKESIISNEMVPKQILDMSFRSTWNGCSPNHTGTIGNLTCVGHRIFDSPQRVYMALSNCRSSNGLLLHYRLEIFGYNDVCSAGGSLLAGSRFLRWTGGHGCTSPLSLRIVGVAAAAIFVISLNSGLQQSSLLTTR